MLLLTGWFLSGSEVCVGYVNGREALDRLWQRQLSMPSCLVYHGVNLVVWRTMITPVCNQDVEIHTRAAVSADSPERHRTSR